MIDQLFMKDLAFDLAPPLETEQPATLLAAGPATSDVGQVTVQGYDPSRDTAGGAFVGTRLNTPKAGQAQPTLQDREKLAIGLLDTLAGALRGAAIETVALPGNIRSIVDMINKEGAEKYFGQAVAPTTEDIKKAEGFTLFGQDIPVPPVLGADVPNRAERQKSVEAAEEVGAYLPAPGVPEAVVQGAKLVGKAIKATKGLPVGMSIQDVGKGMDDLGFYSAAKQAVDAIQQPKGTGDQFLKQIEKTPGVKPDEIKWTGLDEFLKSKKSVTKAEVQEYLDKNRVEIKEVSLADGGLKKKFSVESPEDQDFYDVIDKQGKVIFTGPEDDADYLIDRSLTKFSKYTLPGGENYREVLLTLPAKMVNKDSPEMIKLAKEMYGENSLDRLGVGQWALVSSKLQATPEFRSSHFDEPNILAHLRVNDRIDADGKKVLFVEEVQSDWHQAGRKKGYKSDRTVSDIDKEMDAIVNELRSKPGVEYAPRQEDWDKYPELTARHDALSAERVNAPRSDAVPDAPFKTTWSELAMKRAIQMASEGGYDRIAFTTGKTQAERFDLSKQIDNIQYKPMPDGKYYVSAIDISGNAHLGDRYTIDEVEEYLGKDVAKKISNGAGDKLQGVPEDSTMRELSGIDLSVGGEGMKGFYDDILPKFLNKYAKKWDAKTGMTSIDAGSTKDKSFTEALKEMGLTKEYYSASPERRNEIIELVTKNELGKKVPVHYIDITPKMRESVVTKGQPMFAIGAGGAGAAATQQEDNK